MVQTTIVELAAVAIAPLLTRVATAGNCAAGRVPVLKSLALTVTLLQRECPLTVIPDIANAEAHADPFH